MQLLEISVIIEMATFCTDEADYIDKSDLSLVNWFERIPYVEAATPRLSSTSEMNMTKNGKLIEETRIPIVGVDPFPRC